MQKWKWYLTIAAVRQYMDIAGLKGECELENPDFVAAQNALGDISLTATPASTPPTRSGGIIYRCWTQLRGRRQRIELTVMPSPRDEGSLPQLLRVTLKKR